MKKQNQPPRVMTHENAFADLAYAADFEKMTTGELVGRLVGLPNHRNTAYVVRSSERDPQAMRAAQRVVAFCNEQLHMDPPYQDLGTIQIEELEQRIEETGNILPTAV